MASLEHKSHIGSLCRLNTEQGDCMVAGIKKDYIVNIMESAQDCAFIERIILFGSALEERCGEESDIDIAVFGDKTEYSALRSGDYRKFTNRIYQYGDFQDYDILYFKTGKRQNCAIMKNIDQGQVIYKRGSGGNK